MSTLILAFLIKRDLRTESHDRPAAVSWALASAGCIFENHLARSFRLRGHALCLQRTGY